MNKLNSEADAAMEFLPQSVAWLDEDLNFIGANKNFFKTFKKDEASLIDVHFSQIFDSYSFISFMGQYLRDNASVSEFNQSILVEGCLKHFKITLQKLSSPNRMIVLYLEDVSKLMEKNQEIDVLRARELKSSRMATLGEMSSGIAHQINNPMIAILKCAEEIKDMHLKNTAGNVPQDEVMARLEKILHCSHRVSKILDSLKSFSRDASSDPFQSTLIKGLISESLDLCAEKLKNQKINLIVESIEPGLSLDCRPAQISQILLNLIGNSREAIAELDEKWIKLEVIDVGDFVRFTLIDSGQETIGEEALITSISKNIVDSHYGQIHIDKNSPNSKFVFDIPKGLSAIT